MSDKSDIDLPANQDPKLKKTEKKGLARFVVRLVIAAVFFSAGAYGLVVAGMYFYQEKLLYRPTFYSQRDLEAAANSRLSPLRSKTGRVTGWLRAVENPNALIFIFHGALANALWQLRRTVPLQKENVDLVYIEYPGFGLSHDSISLESLESQVQETVKTVLSNSRYDKIAKILYGESLGTAIASNTAVWGQEQGISFSALVLISPFTTVLEVAQRTYPFLPVSFLMRDQYQNVESLAHLKIPLLVLHGDQDKVVDVSMGKLLYENYSGAPKKFVLLKGFGHGIQLPRKDPTSEFWTATFNFLAPYLFSK